MLVAVVLASFVGLVGVGSGGVHSEYLTQQDWSKVPSTVPVLYIALVFHNVVPVVTTQLEGQAFLLLLSAFAMVVSGKVSATLFV